MGSILERTAPSGRVTVPTAYLVTFSKKAQLALLRMKRGRVIESMIRRQLSVPHLTVDSVPLKDGSRVRLTLVAGYVVYFRFAKRDEPSGLRFVKDIRLLGDVE